MNQLTEEKDTQGKNLLDRKRQSSAYLPNSACSIVMLSTLNCSWWE